MNNEIDLDLCVVMDRLQAARSQVTKAVERSEYACSRIKIIREASDAGVLDIDGRLLNKIEFSAMAFAALVRCAEESIVDADKQLSRAFKDDAEMAVAVTLGDQVVSREAFADIKDAVLQTQGRIEEARKSVELLHVRIDGFELPKLTVA